MSSYNPLELVIRGFSNLADMQKCKEMFLKNRILPRWSEMPFEIDENPAYNELHIYGNADGFADEFFLWEDENGWGLYKVSEAFGVVIEGVSKEPEYSYTGEHFVIAHGRATMLCTFPCYDLPLRDDGYGKLLSDYDSFIEEYVDRIPHLDKTITKEIWQTAYDSGDEFIRAGDPERPFGNYIRSLAFPSLIS